jgi:GrpB-like predicted nucleotidyltransferase (UPF0157 family)
MRLVYLAPPDPLWPVEFEREQADVVRALGDVLLALHHIGSTAIPGLRAKPVIDMLAEVRGLAELDGRQEQMEALGYECLGEFGISGRRYFRKDDSAGNRSHQIHAFESTSPQIERHLAFRNYLRAHPARAEAYEELKEKLAERYCHDLPCYTDGKDEFILQIDREAAAWRASLR